MYQKFIKGRFTVQKTNRKFSRIVLGQIHEQVNSKIKGIGGAIGLTENDGALHRWIDAGPEIDRLVEKFETVFNTEVTGDASPSIQVAFLHDINLMLSAINEQGNPFLDDSKDLYALDTKGVTSQNVVNDLFRVQKLRKAQFQEFQQQ